MYTKRLPQTFLPPICFVILALCPLLEVKSESDFVWCPNTWTSYKAANKCFKVSDDKAKFEAAKEACETDSYSRLVEVQSTDEAAFVCQLQKESATTRYPYYGIRDFNNGPPYTYISDGAEVNIDILNLSPNDQKHEHHNCMCVKTESCEWFDLGCTDVNHYICETTGVDKCRTSNNGGCAHFCNTTGLREVECSCKDGFVLVNQTECIGVCDIDKGNNCSQVCNYNKATGVVCSCHEGYSMDGSDCKKKKDKAPPPDDDEGTKESSGIGAATIIIILILVCISAAVGWLVFDRHRQSAKGVPEPNEDEYAPEGETDEQEQEQADEEEGYYEYDEEGEERHIERPSERPSEDLNMDEQPFEADEMMPDPE